jgi:hypothetical protein
MMINYRQQVRNEESCVRMEIDEVNKVRNSNVVGIYTVQLNQENPNYLNKNYSVQNNLMSQNRNLEESQVRVVLKNNQIRMVIRKFNKDSLAIIINLTENIRISMRILISFISLTFLEIIINYTNQTSWVFQINKEILINTVFLINLAFLVNLEFLILT